MTAPEACRRSVRRADMRSSEAGPARTTGTEPVDRSEERINEVQDVGRIAGDVVLSVEKAGAKTDPELLLDVFGLSRHDETADQ